MKLTITSLSKPLVLLVIVLLAACAKAAQPVAQIDPLSPDFGSQAGEPAVRLEARVSPPPPEQTVPPPVTSNVDAQSILENTCAQCHLIQSLVEINQSRADWERALQQMELLGVHIAEDEEVSLLDYLTGTTKP
jgi:hypothetical protein